MKRIHAVLGQREWLGFNAIQFLIESPAGWFGFFFELSTNRKLIHQRKPSGYRQHLYNKGHELPIVRVGVSQISPDFVHSRNLRFPSLKDHRITLIGFGAIGGYLAGAGSGETRCRIWHRLVDADRPRSPHARQPGQALPRHGQPVQTQSRRAQGSAGPAISPRQARSSPSREARPTLPTSLATWSSTRPARKPWARRSMRIAASTPAATECPSCTHGSSATASACRHSALIRKSTRFSVACAGTILRDSSGSRSSIMIRRRGSSAAVPIRPTSSRRLCRLPPSPST